MTEHTILSTIATIVGGAGFAAIYSILWYARNKAKSDEPFNRYKFAGTVLVGALIGAGFAISGTPITPETISTALTAHIGVIALLEPVLKIIFSEFDLFQNYAG